MAGAALQRGRSPSKSFTSEASEHGSWTEGSSCASAAAASFVSTAAPVAKLGALEEAPSEGTSIICVGVMRTGLKTLERALRNLGYSNIYGPEDIVSTYELWEQVLRNRATTEAFHSIFRGSEVIMGMPTFCFWEEIAQLYPNAQIILTVRDEDEWWESLRCAESLMHSGLPGAPLRYGSAMRRLESLLVPSYHKFCEVLRFAWVTTLGAHALEGESLNEAVARSNYRKHNSYVRSTLAKQATAQGGPKLLVYDVRDGWEPLCKFLGKEEPEVEFPSIMKVPYFPGQQSEGSASPGAGMQSFEDMMLPDCDFGMKMRQELRYGLLKGVAGLAILGAVVLAVLMTTSVEIPFVFVGFVYLVILTVGWNIYVVMHSLVLRVPALLVLPMAMKSLLIAGALQACFISYGILKEMLVTQDRIASPVLVLSSRFGAIVCGGLFMLITERRISFGAPLHAMAAFVFTNEASTWAGYEMLKYVSFPVQVMAKSVNMLPSMLMGRLVAGAQYSAFEYSQAVAALVCVATMHFTDEEGHGGGGGGGRPGRAGRLAAAQLEDMDPYYKLGMGVSVLGFYFACDSFTAQWQGSLYKKYPALTQTQMMLGGNLLGFLITVCTLVVSWEKVRNSLAVAVQQPEVMGRIACLGVVYALGQFCIYSAIRVLGPLSFTWIMTARQLLSVLISLVYFGHGISVTKVVCILIVFGIMSAKQLKKAVPRITRHAQQLKMAAILRSSSFSDVLRAKSISFSDLLEGMDYSVRRAKSKSA